MGLRPCCWGKAGRWRFLRMESGRSRRPRNRLHSSSFCWPRAQAKPRDLTKDNINHSWAHWFPDGKRVLFTADEPGKGVRFYVYDVESGKSQAISHEGVNGTAFMISPDSQQIAAIGPDQKGYLYPVSGGGCRLPLRASIRASSRSRGVPTASRSTFTSPANCRRGSIGWMWRRGSARCGRSSCPAILPGWRISGPILMTPDAKTCVFGYHRMLADLYLVEGLK